MTKPDDGQNLNAEQVAKNLAEVPQLDEIEIVCFLTGGKHYQFYFEFETWQIEMHPELGPCMLRKNFDPVQNPNYPPAFWRAVEYLKAMSEAERQRCEI